MAGAYLASVVEGVAGDIEFTVPAWYVLVPYLVFQGFLVILIHELGHVFGGLAARFRFVMMIAGPFKLTHEAGGLKLGLNRWLQMSGGLALCIPEKKLDTPGRFFMYIAGGPLASLITAGVSALLAYSLHSATYTEAWMGYAVFFLVCSALFNGGIALVTLLPLPTEGYDNDGKQLLDLFRGGTRGKRKYLLQALTAEALRGDRPRDWTASYIEEMLAMQAEMSDKMDTTTRLMAYFFYLDRGDIEAAGACIDFIHDALDDAPSMLQPALWLEVLYYHTRLRRDVKLDPVAYKYDGPFVEKHAVARLEASLLAAEGKGEAAVAKAREGIELSRQSSLQVGVARAEAEWMQQIIDEISGASTTASTIDAAATSDAQNPAGM